MIIVADQNIPRVADAFSTLGEVRLMPGREIRREHLNDCQCLILRTVTRVDAGLLDGSAVEFVGTATIGTDHMDLDYLAAKGIAHANAAGCNAESAAEYVVSGLFALSRKLAFDPLRRRAGIVGYGNVGSRLCRKLEILGIECLVCDPPLVEAGNREREFVDLERVLSECDLISLHVPLTRDGGHPTFHLLDDARLQQLGRDCLLINAARGEVVDNAALLALLQRRPDLQLYLDTWEGEPLVLRELLQRVDLATPHIAGYSVEGRLRGTQMVLDAACAHFQRSSDWRMSRHTPPPQSLAFETGSGRTEFWQNLFQAHCDIWRDHEAFVATAPMDDEARARGFDDLRRVYPQRLEYTAFELTVADWPVPESLPESLGFGLKAD